MNKPIVGITMGADKDLEVMAEAARLLDEFAIAYELRILSAHRTPDVMIAYGQTAQRRGIKVIIAGAGGSAHLPGMLASETPLPVLAVPVKPSHHDHEALWSSIKMPTNIPLATMPENGARNAALFAVRILALDDAAIAQKYAEFVKNLHDAVVKTDQDLQTKGWKQFLAK